MWCRGLVKAAAAAAWSSTCQPCPCAVAWLVAACCYFFVPHPVFGPSSVCLLTLLVCCTAATPQVHSN